MSGLLASRSAGGAPLCTSTSPYAPSALAWLSKDPDQRTRDQLESLLARDDADSHAELQMAFKERLAFGTAGLRGIVGPGPGRMNLLVVQETTLGLARFVKEEYGEDAARNQGVVVAYDGRLDSESFAASAACVLAAQGITVHLFMQKAPTPLCGFAVRKLHARAGIVVTASHNPPEYNGYKVYRAGGTQINTPMDDQIARHIDEVAKETRAPLSIDLLQAVQKGFIRWLEPSIFDEYAQAILDRTSAPLSPAPLQPKDFKVAYTPLHGVGAPVGEELLKRRGYAFFTVPEQREPDGHFPTVKFPNPEESGAMDKVIALANQQGCEIAIANDPDADRLSVCARNKSRSMIQLSGDDIGSLLGDALLRRAEKRGAERGSDLSKSWVLNTIVSSRLLARLALKYGASHRETPTGFKWLGPAASQLEEAGDEFLFAYEEALGYMVLNLVWDKDGLSALLLLADLAFELRQEGKTLLDRLEEVHRSVGLAVNTQRTIRLTPGMSGAEVMKRIRSNLPSRLGEHEVLLIEDLKDAPKAQDCKEGQMPSSDVVRFYFETPDIKRGTASLEEIRLGAPRIQVRPSGTEPKVKIYCESALSPLHPDAEYATERVRIANQLEDIVNVTFDFLRG
ncbi:putative phosphomannomutase [Ceraceosorus guamensis]|uniref:Putative phosphomannomutase n=1 Tax=Ceraceosorus guamensis TaxID=1522189 RepID=A0A316VQ46_9BASI|nr:putative phosphomannomutase [Ceraceosorus guamensis]PWN39716.1 putative phosphomannomutase [Ceraceosorus guamensis]